MSTDAGKLACFEGLAARYPDDRPAAAPAMKEQPAPVESQPAERERPPASVAAATIPGAEVASDSNQTLVQAADVEAADDFGREEQRSKPEALSATVSEVSADRLRRLVFQFENGQVWRQQEPRHFPYPRNEPFDVVISRGLLGDYQLRVGGEGRMTRVRRLK